MVEPLPVIVARQGHSYFSKLVDVQSPCTNVLRKCDGGKKNPPCHHVPLSMDVEFFVRPTRMWALVPFKTLYVIKKDDDFKLKLDSSIHGI